jgi:uncharacterized protein (DUF1697 family)
VVSYVAFLRGINVGGHKVIKMAHLAEICSGLGLRQVRTYMQSGNVLFRSAGRDAAALTARIEQGLRPALGYEVPVMLRTAAQVRGVMRRDPFRQEKLRATGKFYVVFLSAAPTPAAARTMESRSTAYELYRVQGQELYVLVTSDPARRLTFAGSVVERVLGVRATARNWKVVGEIAALLQRGKAASAKGPRAR